MLLTCYADVDAELASGIVYLIEASLHVVKAARPPAEQAVKLEDHLSQCRRPGGRVGAKRAMATTARGVEVVNDCQLDFHSAWPESIAKRRSYGVSVLSEAPVYTGLIPLGRVCVDPSPAAPTGSGAHQPFFGANAAFASLGWPDDPAGTIR